MFISINIKLSQILSPCPTLKWIAVRALFFHSEANVESGSRVSKLRSMFCVTLFARLSVDSLHMYGVTALALIEKAHTHRVKRFVNNTV